MSDSTKEMELCFWLKVRLESKIKGIDVVDEAAKQLVGITGLLQGIYFAAISISDVKKVGTIQDAWFLAFVFFSMITVLLWLGCLSFAVKAFLPREYHPNNYVGNQDSTEFIKQISNMYEKVLSYKQKKLRTASTLLWLSFIPLSTNLAIYLIFPLVPPT